MQTFEFGRPGSGAPSPQTTTQVQPPHVNCRDTQNVVVREGDVIIAQTRLSFVVGRIPLSPRNPRQAQLKSAKYARRLNTDEKNRLR